MTNNSSPNNADPLLRKVLLGRYIAKRIVSATVETVTYEAVDQTTGAVLRIVRPVRASEVAALDSSRLRELNEAILRLRGIPGLVLPVAAGVVDSHVFLVLPSLGRHQPFSGGKSPKNEGPMASPPQVPAWLKPAGDTLDAVHGRGLFHGRLSPEALVTLEDGQVAIDGLPLALAGRAIGQVVAPVSPKGAGWARYAAPEVVAGKAPSAVADQYALARIVAEALGVRPEVASGTTGSSGAPSPAVPPPVARALAAKPGERFAGCGQFVGALVVGAGGPAGSVASQAGDVPVLEMAPVLGQDNDRGGRGRAAPAEKPLELGDSFAATKPQPRAEARRLATDDEDELLDITFTKPGEDLLTQRSKLSQAASFGSSRETWRRIVRDFQQLSSSRKVVVRAVAGVAAIVLAFVLLSVAWRVAVGVTNWVRGTWETAKTSILPDSETLKNTGKNAIDKATQLWSEWKPKDTGAGSPSDTELKPPPKVGSLKVAGDVWPERPEDQLLQEDLAEPVAMIDELTASKDKAPAQEAPGFVRGVFAVPEKDNKDQLEWVGGFTVSLKGAKPTSSDSPVLDGTIMNYREDGSILVATYEAGEMTQFWLIKDDQGEKTTISARVGRIGKDLVTLNGAAFVLNEGVPECLALVYEDGDLVGGQWCTKVNPESTDPPLEGVAFEAPTDIVSPDKLATVDAGFDAASKQLAAAVEQLPAWHVAARKALRDRYKKVF
jgi:hypothetical protein